jgi:hypothetical protein
LSTLERVAQLLPYQTYCTVQQGHGCLLWGFREAGDSQRALQADMHSLAAMVPASFVEQGESKPC